MYWNWISDNYRLIQWIGIASILLFFLSLFILRCVIIQLPDDYFLNDSSALNKRSGNLIDLARRVAKNLFGFLLIICGIILLFIPGQGLVTIVLGAWIMDLPWIIKIKRKFVYSRLVKKTLNWVRSKNGISLFKFP
ncbi:MAG TPA: hypothetical protein EYG40_05770 [Verrucomicrobia bacterium]|nr:hypothetical protein [Verrucomicrobiales bacterium]HIL54527.1 hypothetical protein [Verrucomicrobiota bacterium]